MKNGHDLLHPRSDKERVEWLLSMINRSITPIGCLIFGTTVRREPSTQWEPRHIDEAIERSEVQEYVLTSSQRTDSERLGALLEGLGITVARLDVALNRNLKPRGRVEFWSTGVKLPAEGEQ